MTKILFDDRTLLDLVASDANINPTDFREILLGATNEISTKIYLKDGYEFITDFWFFDDFIKKCNIIKKVFKINSDMGESHHLLSLLSEKKVILPNHLFGDLEGTLDPETIDYRIKSNLFLTNFKTVIPNLSSGLIYMLEDRFSTTEVKKFYKTCGDYSDNNNIPIVPQKIFTSSASRQFYIDYLRHRVRVVKTENFLKKFASYAVYTFDIQDDFLRIDNKKIQIEKPTIFMSLSNNDQEKVVKTLKSIFENEYSYLHPFG